MLNQRKDVLTARLPLLITQADGQWHLVAEVKRVDAQQIEFTCIKDNHADKELYSFRTSEEPFHVAENIWELSYGTEIMTLLDDTLADHPAKKLWETWK